MELKIENLGKIKNGEIKTNDFMVICGPNNDGKTYLAYSLYGIDEAFETLELELTAQEKKDLINVKTVIIPSKIITERIIKKNKDVANFFKRNLNKFFNYEKDFFKNTKITLEFNSNDFFRGFKKEVLVKVRQQTAIKIAINEQEDLVIEVYEENLDIEFIEHIINRSFHNLVRGKTFILPSVREGLNLFKSELNVNRNVLIDTLMSMSTEKSKKLNPFSMMANVVSRYPKPISDYIEFLNDLEGKLKEKGPLEKIAKEVGKIVQGNYSYENTQIYFKPDKSEGIKLPLHMASSTVRTLAGLYMYLKYEQNPKRLIIDEPELNLHPANQRKIARILAKIANSGVDIIITTHSSYIMQELNILLMLSSSFENRKKLMQKYKYTEDEILKKEKVTGYLISNGTINEMPMEKEGLVLETFNNVIDPLNDLHDQLIYNLEMGE